jgi:predicted PurR-regulated permease PerM
MREHAREAKALSENAGHTIVRILLGMVIGAMVSLHDNSNSKTRLPLAAALIARASTLSRAFKKIVFAQARISAVNTSFTAIYILIVLPLAGVNLPLSKSLIVITFIAGLLPIIGNLISNTILVIVTLPFGLPMAFASLLFLIVLHKLEYFLNAKIIGTEIKAQAWELLIAMLVMESLFGLTGVVAAPVLYAYLKQELMHRQLI